MLGGGEVEGGRLTMSSNPPSTYLPRTLGVSLQSKLCSPSSVPRPPDTPREKWTHRVHAVDEVRHLIVVVVVRLYSVGSKSTSVTLLSLVRLGNLAQALDRLGTKLVEDAGNELSELLLDSSAVDRVGVGSDSGVDCAWSTASAGGARGRRWKRDGRNGLLTLGSGEVDHVAVVLEHVDLLDTCRTRTERSISTLSLFIASLWGVVPARPRTTWGRWRAHQPWPGR